MATYTKSRRATTVTIADNASLSDAIDLSATDGAIVGIIVPTGWVAAAITFQASVDGDTWYELYKTDGTVVSIASPTTNTWIAINPGDFAGVPHLKLRSGTVGVTVPQTGGPLAVTIVSRNV